MNTYEHMAGSDRPIRAHVLAVLAIVATVALVGCSDDGGEADEPAVKVSDADSKKPSGDTGDLENPEGAIAALSDFKCEPDDSGAWSAHATLTNDGGTRVRYIVTATVIKSKTHEVLGRANDVVTLRPGRTKEIELSDIYNKDGKGLQCIARAVAGS